jgi:5-(carboxyamino)imidazole ribonucleotide mutase
MSTKKAAKVTKNAKAVKAAKPAKPVAARDSGPVSGAKVAVVMGSTSDWPVMRHAVLSLEQLGIACERRVVSAHRTPRFMMDFAEAAAGRGIQIIIAGAGGAAHLPGMIAALTPLPVLGVPVPSRHLQGQDSLLSIVQMPRGIPVATFAIGEAGAVNAGLFAGAMLALQDKAVAKRLNALREKQTQVALDSTLPANAAEGA